MRKIKFRGKDHDGKWYFGDLVHFKDSNGIEDGTLGINNGSDTITKILPETVGEFTGLQDSKGVDIYEGDICVFFSDIPSEKFIVVWDTSYCGFYCVNPNDESDGGVLCLVDIKVIGNIHDNPELLKEGD